MFESWFFLLILGVLSAITLSITDFLIKKCVEFKHSILTRVDSTPLAFLFWILISALFSAISGLSVYYISPHGGFFFKK